MHADRPGLRGGSRRRKASETTTAEWLSTHPQKNPKAKMDDAKTEMLTAIEVARSALKAWRKNQTAANFRVWRDASEVAIKWQREVRRTGAEEESFEDEPSASRDLDREHVSLGHLAVQELDDPTELRWEVGWPRSREGRPKHEDEGRAVS